MARVKYQPNQPPFPVVFVAEPPARPNKTQVGVIHVASLAAVPQAGDRVWLPRPPEQHADPFTVMPRVIRRQIRYKPSEPNEPAVIEYVEVFLT